MDSLCTQTTDNIMPSVRLSQNKTTTKKFGKHNKLFQVEQY